MNREIIDKTATELKGKTLEQELCESMQALQAECDRIRKMLIADDEETSKRVSQTIRQIANAATGNMDKKEQTR